MVRVDVVDGDLVSVDLGRPRCTGSSTAALGSLTLPGVAVDCGNPHLVCALSGGRSLDDLDLLRAPRYDPAVFPAGRERRVHRPATGDGADCTWRCGCTSAARARPSPAAPVRARWRRSPCATPAETDGTVTVDVPGGRLTVTFDGAACWLAGPAVLVATGEIDVAALSA